MATNGKSAVERPRSRSAEATGFEPAISALTGPRVRPLHHASALSRQEYGISKPSLSRLTMTLRSGDASIHRGVGQQRHSGCSHASLHQAPHRCGAIGVASVRAEQAGSVHALHSTLDAGYAAPRYSPRRGRITSGRSARGEVPKHSARSESLACGESVSSGLSRRVRVQ